MATDQDDELGQTATAQAPSGGPATPATPVGATLGRYRLERELGVGGMGVVHAAFDPDLERRVALKVLRAAGTEEARKRLLREARAMARLTHANVVTVHEVGSVDGRDYVAMELIDGETLADWLRGGPHAPAAVVDAFVDAGRGLAAAHAEGIVHRDFKPHNVLRSRKGRIVVTDFGLAREATLGTASPVAAPEPATDVATATTTPSSLSGLTLTGSVLGTPAYMAPEQWAGGAVTHATDQFGFCVALWEALAGERPYPGPTLDELRAQVAAGPQALDASKIPRRLRPTLIRGLDPDPGKRWPSMDALLHRLIRAERGPGVALVVGVVGVVAAALVVFAVRSRADHATLPPCPAPILDPATVWSSGAPDVLTRAGQGLAARALAADLDRWHAVRARACAADPAVASPRLACLDGVLARMHDVAGALGQLHGTRNVDAARFLISPDVCAAPTPPRLSTIASPALQEVLAATLRDLADPAPADPAVTAPLIARVEGEPCAAAFAHLLGASVPQLAAQREHDLSVAEQAADRCGDDRVRAEVALAGATNAFDTEILGGALGDKLSRADAAVHRVAQPDLVAEVDSLRMDLAGRSGNYDEAIARGEAAMAGFHTRGRLAAELTTGTVMLEYQIMRGKPDDIAQVLPTLARWRAQAVSQLGEDDPLVRKLDHTVAIHRFNAGEVAEAHALFERSQRKEPQRTPIALHGQVVDAAGAPVAGARVVTATALFGDALGVIMFSDDGSRRDATTGPDGSFAITDAPAEGVVIALGAEGERRSAATATSAAAPVTLRLAPTSRIEGRVELHGALASSISVTALPDAQPRGLGYTLIAPVAADGSFAISGAPRGPHQVSARSHRFSDAQASFAQVDVRAPVVRGVALEVHSSSRQVQVIVRSTVGVAVQNAQVLVSPGTIASSTADKLHTIIRSLSLGYGQPIEGEHAPKAVLANARTGDLYATMRAPDGPATACALGLPGDLADPGLQHRIDTHLAQIEVRCVPIPEGAEVVTVEVPPFPRLD